MTTLGREDGGQLPTRRRWSRTLRLRGGGDAGQGGYSTQTRKLALIQINRRGGQRDVGGEADRIAEVRVTGSSPAFSQRATHGRVGFGQLGRFASQKGQRQRPMHDGIGEQKFAAADDDAVQEGHVEADPRSRQG